MKVTIPASALPGLHKFAIDWNGAGKWQAEWHWDRTTAWFSSPVLPDTENMSDSSRWLSICQLPLHIPAGFDLAVRYLAHRHGHNGPALFMLAGDSERAPELEHLTGGRLVMWMIMGDGFDVDFDSEDYPELLDLHEKCDACGGSKLDYGPYPPVQCPICDATGKNPHLAELALQACLLAKKEGEE